MHFQLVGGNLPPSSENHVTCNLCLGNITPLDQKIALTCHHIFHSDCLGDVFFECPTCDQPIAKKAYIYNPIDFDLELFSLSIEIKSLFPCLQNRFSNASFLKLFKEKLANNLKGSVKCFYLVKAINQCFRKIINASDKDIQQYAAQDALRFIQLFMAEIHSNPVKLRDNGCWLELEDGENVIGRKIGLKIVEEIVSYGVSQGAINGAIDKFRTYLNLIVKRTVEDKRILHIFNTRQEKFIKLHQAHCSNLSEGDVLKHVYQLKSSEKKLLLSPQAKQLNPMQYAKIKDCIAKAEIINQIMRFCLLIGIYYCLFRSFTRYSI